MSDEDIELLGLSLNDAQLVAGREEYKHNLQIHVEKEMLEVVRHIVFILKRQKAVPINTTFQKDNIISSFTFQRDVVML